MLFDVLFKVFPAPGAEQEEKVGQRRRTLSSDAIQLKETVQLWAAQVFQKENDALQL